LTTATSIPLTDSTTHSCRVVSSKCQPVPPPLGVDAVDDNVHDPTAAIGTPF
jgi:hypothetical protein